ncbi:MULTISPECIES: hypothetical protein [unclassified Brevibacterium]|uniref:hypothetical protein n=1 Tax=unclassified Brevibacterium TaxID=2614124 RepID=UPI001E3EF2D0|nr:MULTISPECIES: hypothetical protein [unclassified Brevibacterium]MCD1285894.1 hypothetical protein [Brevibacterium sp. CCUG 69071]MDK8434958.1 hypothetical protein [Brevibacterium sp. H-BE7]
MNTIIRRDGNISTFVAWMLACMGVLAIIVLVILAIFADPMLLIFLFGPVLLFIGAWVNYHLGSRSRLEITPERFIWCGSIGRPRSIEWQHVDRILIPPRGARPRLAAVARLRNGQHVEIDALWLSPTSPANLLTTPDHREAQHALIEGHKAFLARAAGYRR